MVTKAKLPPAVPTGDAQAAGASTSAAGAADVMQQQAAGAAAPAASGAKASDDTMGVDTVPYAPLHQRLNALLDLLLDSDSLLLKRADRKAGRANAPNDGLVASEEGQGIMNTVDRNPGHAHKNPDPNGSPAPSNVAESLPAKHPALQLRLSLSQWLALLQASGATSIHTLLQRCNLTGEVDIVQVVERLKNQIPTLQHTLEEWLGELTSGQRALHAMVMDLNGRVGELSAHLLPKQPDPAVVRDNKVTRMALRNARQEAGELWDDLTEAARVRLMHKAKAALTAEAVDAEPTLPDDMAVVDVLPMEDMDTDGENRQVRKGSHGGSPPLIMFERPVEKLPWTGLAGDKLIPAPRFNLPAPTKFLGTLDKSISCARTWLQQVREYLRVHQQPFVPRFPHYLDGDAAKWASSLYATLRAQGKLDDTHVATEFLLQYGDLLRPEAERARDLLFNKKHAMGRGMPYGTYVSKYRQLMREAAPMAMSDQIRWFQEGLTPELRAACAVRPDTGKPWDDLDALIQFGVGQEVRSTIVANTAPSLAAMRMYPGNNRRTNVRYGYTARPNNPRSRPPYQGGEFKPARGKKRPTPTSGAGPSANGGAKKQPRTCSYCGDVITVHPALKHLLKCEAAQKAMA
jgi:hypothetical protein